jgi:predicted permease
VKKYMAWSRFFRRGRWDDERRRELESYIQIEIDDALARGESPQDARRHAYRKLGNPTLVREEIFRMNTIGWLESLWQDLRYGARLLRLNPSFAAVALLSLVLGIGANTAIFQLLDAVRHRTLPVPHPEEIVEIRIAPNQRGRNGQFNGRRAMLTRPLWNEIRRQPDGFSTLFAWSTTTFDLSTTGESRFVDGLWVSERFFEGVGVSAAAGRLATVADGVATCASAPVVLGHSFWQREYGGARDVIGRTIRLEGRPLEIAGVAPAGFRGMEVGRDFDVAVPLCAREVLQPVPSHLDDRAVWWLAVYGRLAPGWSLERATTALETRSKPIFESTVSPGYGVDDAKSYLAFKLMAQDASMGFSTLRNRYDTSLTLLLGIAGLVLLIACANLANLLLARGSARGREIAVRLALGASRWRVVRQLMAESLLLAVLGAGFGLLLAQWLSRALVASLGTETATFVLDLPLDWRLAGFSVGLAVLTCLLFGLAPALRATRTGPAAALRTDARGLTAGRDRFLLRRSLVVAQLAISLVLVVGALLFVRTFANLGAVNPGFRQQGVLVAGLDLRPAGIAADQQREFQRGILDRLAALPGVAGAASAAIVPVSGSGWNEILIVDGRKQDAPYPNVNRVSADYFRTMQIPIVGGRGFEARDTIAAPRVAIVSQSFVTRFLPGASPIGRTFRIGVGPGDPDPMYEVIGVVADTHYTQLRETVGPIIYFPDSQEPEPQPYLAVLLATDGAADALRSSVVRAASEAHPGILVSLQTLDRQIRDLLVRERLMAALSAGFAVLAVVLAAAGLYGVMAYTVARRRSEIGIRLALGATRGRVMKMIVRETAWLVGIGAIAGVALAIYAARWTSTLLFGLSPFDPVTIAGAAILLGVVAALASAWPAFQATRMAPTAALRDQ